MPNEGRNRSSEEMLIAKSTPGKRVGDGQEKHADGGNRDRPGQSPPVGRAGRLICRNKKQNRELRCEEINHMYVAHREEPLSALYEEG